MTASINGTTGVTFPDASVQGTAATGFGFKNRIINGAMVINQRNYNGTPTSDGTYTLDRWAAGMTQASKFSVSQNAGSVTPPVGYKNYIGVTSTSAYSVAAGDYFVLYQAIEGYNIADLGWGAAEASAVTLSFWVRSSLTGTFGGSLWTSAGGAYVPFSYTVSSANTWTQISVTIPGPTIGNWNSTNTTGVYVNFGLGAGSTYAGGTAGTWSSNLYTQPAGTVSVVGTNGATFYITGVQLEKGSTATSFDYRPYGTELALCQRYYWQETSTNYSLSQPAQTSSYRITRMRNPVTMRANATYVATVNNGTPNYDSYTTLGVRIFTDVGTGTTDLTAITATAEL